MREKHQADERELELELMRLDNCVERLQMQLKEGKEDIAVAKQSA